MTEPLPGAALPAELFLLVECIASTLERAEEVVRTMKQYLLHFGYPGRLTRQQPTRQQKYRSG